MTFLDVINWFATEVEIYWREAQQTWSRFGGSQELVVTYTAYRGHSVKMPEIPCQFTGCSFKSVNESEQIAIAMFNSHMMVHQASGGEAIISRSFHPSRDQKFIKRSTMRTGHHSLLNGSTTRDVGKSRMNKRLITCICVVINHWQDYLLEKTHQ